MKKSLYDSLIKVIKHGEFNNYECFNELYSIDYKYDGDFDVEDFINDIIDYGDELKEKANPTEYELDMGCCLTFELNENSELFANYKAKIDWVETENDFSYDYKEKINELGIQRFLNFEHKNFSIDNLILNVNLSLNSYPQDINYGAYSLKYKIDDLVIDIQSQDLKIEIIDILKETLLVSGYSSYFPIYRGEFEMALEINNNEVVVFNEYYNKQIITVIPE